ncbi:hypothetical protein V8G54_029284 [Vigna mungo]|uniref:Uncharacterized protein n=1 Tax=Vigna mungo TaxID=3915 RepID=A0AAQ3MUF8_VIGMU
MDFRLSSLLIFLVFSNILIANAAFDSNILNLQGLNMEERVKVGSSSSPSPDGSNNEIKAPKRLTVRTVKNIHFHALPKGPIPPSGPSHGCSDPSCDNDHDNITT